MLRIRLEYTREEIPWKILNVKLEYTTRLYEFDVRRKTLTVM